MLGYTVSEAHRLGMGVDMTTGTGWCFGGPNVTDREANASVVVKTFDWRRAKRFKKNSTPGNIQALMAFCAGRQNRLT